jgi:hypothetical protein
MLSVTIPLGSNVGQTDIGAIAPRWEDWAEIRRLHRAEGMPIKAISRHLGVARNTVRKALASSEPPTYRRVSKGSIVDAVEPQIRELLREFPEMPATVIAERIGWSRSMTVLKDRVRLLRVEYKPADPASRTTYQPGELAQCDLWFPPVRVPVGAGRGTSLPVLVMVSGYSRWLMARAVPLEYWITWPDLRLCGVAVFIDHARHDRSSPDDPQAGEAGRVPGRQRFKVWRSLAPGLLRPRSVVMVQVLTKHRCQMAFTEDQGPVQELTTESADDAFADGVHPRRLWQSGDDPQPFGIEHLTERGSEQRIAIMNQEPQRVEAVPQVHG